MGTDDWGHERLVDYQPALTKEADFDAFWDANLAESRNLPLNAEFVEIEDSLPLARVYDVAFDGVGQWSMYPSQISRTDHMCRDQKFRTVSFVL